jgi:hypothetical protein
MARVKVVAYPAGAAAIATDTRRGSGGFVVIEAETAPLVSDWKVERADRGFTGAGYLVWRGPDHFWEPGIAQIGWRFRAGKPGLYILKVHNRHESPQGDDENDTWLKFDDGPWRKFVSSAKGHWTWEMEYEGGAPVEVRLGAGEHTLSLPPGQEGTSSTASSWS